MNNYSAKEDNQSKVLRNCIRMIIIDYLYVNTDILLNYLGQICVIEKVEEASSGARLKYSHH